MAEPFPDPVRAGPADVDPITELVDEYAGPGYLLPREQEEIRQSIDLWYVVREAGELRACGSLLPYSEALAEVRSMAVAPGHKGRGLGSSILTALIAEGEKRGYETLFALTRAVPFFEGHGFVVSQRLDFPEKVWRDCLSCPFIDNCDETTVVLDLPREPAEVAGIPPEKRKGVYHAEKRS